MEPKSPEMPISEIQPRLDPHFQGLINESLNATIGQLSKTIDTRNRKISDYLDDLDIIGSAMDSDSNYAIREIKPDKLGILHINMAPKDKINPDSSILFLHHGPVKECQININRFYRYKGRQSEFSKEVNDTSYNIDICVRQFALTTDGNVPPKLDISDKLAGITIRLYEDERCETFLKPYLGEPNAKSSTITIENSKNIVGAFRYLNSLKVPQPVNNKP